MTFRRLLAEFGSAQSALHALPEIARKAGTKDYAPCSVAHAKAEVRQARKLGARMLCSGNADYPARLDHIADAPPVLWTLGNRQVLERPCIAIVGTRNLSSLGARMARILARDLGNAGWVVVSGMARGTDTLAHTAALPTGTIAVHPGGLDVIYPPENADMAALICDQGLRISEHPFGTAPQARHFPRRNRIVSGLCRAVIVVEAAARSGSLITAQLALDQGRDVMAVPGHPLDARATGCNMLIRDGAHLVRTAEDVITSLSDTPTLRDTPDRPDRLDDGKGGPQQGDMRETSPKQHRDAPGPAPHFADQRHRTGQVGKTPLVRVIRANGKHGNTGRRSANTALGDMTQENIGVPARPAHTGSDDTTRPPSLGKKILGLLGPSPVQEDRLMDDISHPVGLVASTIAKLELEGWVERLPGGLIARIK